MNDSDKISEQTKVLNLKEECLVLVTGASGFLGRHLVGYLSEKGKRIRALYHKNPPGKDALNLPGVSWMQCNLLDIAAVEEALEGVQEVYHCAAIVSFHPSQKEKLVQFNVESTANVINEALEKNIRKLVFISSVAALGRSEDRKEVTEGAVWEESKYNSRYGLSKYFSEMEVWRGAAEGLNMVILNPGIILGEPLTGGKDGWDDGSARLMKVVHQEFPFYSQGINAWVDVKDVACAAVRLMESDISSERFILSAGNFSYREIFSEMAHALQKKPPFIKAGKVLTGLVWRWSLIRSFIFKRNATITRETATTAQKKVFYNSDKLKFFLKDFEYTDLKTTISRMATAFLKDHS